MKNLKRVAALALSLLLFAMLLPTVLVRAADTDLRYGRTKLSSVQQYIYDALVVGCETAKADIKIDISGRNVDLENDLQTAFAMFYSDYPEYFWVTGGWSAASNGVTLTVQPQYSIPGGDLNAAKSKYNKAVQDLISGLSGSEYEKSKTLHDRLIDKVVYAHSNNDQNAYGVLVEGKAVCNGYAKAYQHLMNQAGIPAWYVQGDSVNPATGTSVSHAWNIVKIDGDWYYTDVTWDDQGDNTFYAYFNITTEQLLEGHTIDSEYARVLPKATASAANFYKKEGRIFTEYDQNKLVNFLIQDGKKTQIYVDGNLNAFLASVKENMLSIGKQLGGTGAFGVSYSSYELGHALIFEFVLVSENHTHKTKTAVAMVKESCRADGKKAYYICDCGSKFLDEACTKSVNGDGDLTIPALAHTPSGYTSDGIGHWKVCTVCGTEIADSRGSHTDENADNQCDTCTYVLMPQDQDSANNGIEDSSEKQDESDAVLKEDEPDVVLKEDEPDVVQKEDKTDVNSDEKDSQTNLKQPNEPSQGQPPKRPVVLYVSVIAVVAVAATVVVLVKKKN